MRLFVKHTNDFHYEKPVFLEPHVIRMRPSENPAQRLSNYDLQLTPQPAGSCDRLDLEGNVARRVWFSDLTATLRAVVQFEVETSRENPFDFLMDPVGESLPVKYGQHDSPDFIDACRRLPSDWNDSAIHAFAQEIATEANMQTTTFLTLLTSRIATRCELIYRQDGEPLRPVETLNNRTGACRDHAVLFMAAARMMGLASRFVSGYCRRTDIDESDDGYHSLHAWAEAYLPGVGWQGYDPSLGIAIGDAHVSLAASADPLQAAPISGTYRGQAESTITTRVEVTCG